MIKAVVMAGGEGARLRPITLTRPKTLVPVVNKPVLIHALDLLRQNNVYDVIVTLNYLGDQIVDLAGTGDAISMRIEYSFESDPLGTAGGVKAVESKLDDTFLVISGDLLTDFDISSLLKFHRERDAIMTIATTNVQNPTDYGIIDADEEGRVTRYLEKPSPSDVFTNSVNSGLYVIEPEAMRYIKERSPSDFSRDLIPTLIESGQRLFATNLDGFWCDVGRTSEYLNANYKILQGKTGIRINGTKMPNDVWIGEGADISDTADIQGPTVIGENTRVSRDAQIGPLTVLGSNVIVESGAKVIESVVFDSSKISSNSLAVECTLAKDVTLEEGAKVGRMSVVGDGCIINKWAEISHAAKIWPNQIIKAGILVQEDVT